MLPLIMVLLVFFFLIFILLLLLYKIMGFCSMEFTSYLKLRFCVLGFPHAKYVHTLGTRSNAHVCLCLLSIN